MFEAEVIGPTMEKFLIGTCASGSFKYIGLNISRDSKGCTTMDQLEYIQSMETFSINPQRSSLKMSELSDSEKSEYRALLGQLNWISTHTRPDIAFAVCALSASCKNATVWDLLRIKKIMHKFKNYPVKVYFPKLEGINCCKFECFSDALFANLPGSISQGGFIIFLVDDSGNKCPVFLAI